MKNKKQVKEKIENDPDYIHCPRLGNSLKKLLDVVENSSGIPDERICKVLLISQKELDSIYESAIKKLREYMLNGNDN